MSSLIYNFINQLRQKYLIFFISFIISVLVTYPAIFHLNNRLIGDGGDNYQYFSFQYIVSQKLKNFQNPFSHSDIFRYPNGFEFSRGYDSVINALLGGIMSLIINPIVTYNLVVIILISLNITLSYLLFYYIIQSKIPAYIGAISYGVSSYVLARSAGHINLIFIGGFPFFTYCLLRLEKEELSSKNLFLFFSSLTLIFLGSFQYTLMLFIYILISLPLLLLFYKKNLLSLIKKFFLNKEKIFIVSIPFISIFIFFSLPYLTGFYKNELGLNTPRSSWEFYPQLTDYFFPNQFSRLFISKFFQNFNNSPRSIERVVYLGSMEIYLFILFLILRIPKRLKFFILAQVIISFIISSGRLSHTFLMNIFPFKFIPETNRFFVFLSLFLNIGVILAIEQILRKIHDNKYYLLIVVFITMIIFFERLPLNFWLSPSLTDKTYVKLVKLQKGEAVLDIPVDDSFYTSTYNLLPYLYNKKIISGYFHYLADNIKSKDFLHQDIINRFICNKKNNIDFDKSRSLNKKLIETLVKNKIYTIVVHKNDPEDHAKYFFPECANVRMETSILLPQLLMPDATDKQKILSIFFPAIANYGDTISFPSDGIFFIDGIHAYPINQLPLNIYLNGNKLKFNQSWTNRGKKNATWDPYYKLKVKKGDRLTFKFSKNHNLDYSFVKIWYRYWVQPNQWHSSLSNNGIKKIYEDDDAAVFVIEKNQ